MIVTVTLNPAVDKTYQTGTVTLGQINRMKKAMNIPGGKGINVSTILRKFDKDVIATGFLGGYNGRFIEDSMAEIGVGCDFVHVEEETRTCINIIGEDGLITELLEPGPQIMQDQLNELLKKFNDMLLKADFVVLSGSAAMGLPVDIYATLITACNNHGVPVILDTSGSNLMEGIKALPTVIKPNLRELEVAAGKKLKEISEIAEVAKIINSMGVQKVIATMGSRGLVYVDDEECFYVSAPRVKTVSTVGCGDCVTAATAIALTSGQSTMEMLKFVSAVGAANAMTMENGNIDMSILPSLMDEVTIKAL